MTASLGGQIERDRYRADGYVLLKGLFLPAVLAEFHRRLRTDLDLGNSSHAYTTQGPLLSKASIEIYSHQYFPMASFLWGLTPVAARITGCDLVPTYAYFRFYQQGDICRVHSDRHACEHSLSLTVDLSEDREWALSVGRNRLDQPTAAVEEDFGDEEFAMLPMVVGDAVLYQGVHYRHGRIDPNPNSWSAHLFMHWVDPKGPYADHAFDRVMLEKQGMTS